jgi:hypothetical protein
MTRFICLSITLVTVVTLLETSPAEGKPPGKTSGDTACHRVAG